MKENIANKHYEDDKVTIYRKSNGNPKATLIYIPGNAYFYDFSNEVHLFCEQVMEKTAIDLQIIVPKCLFKPNSLLPHIVSRLYSSFNHLVEKKE